MKKINIVRKNLEFNNIIDKGYKFKSNLFFVYMLKNEYDYNRYGIAISKHLGNAVKRNKFKRQIRDIIDDIDIEFRKLDLIFIARPLIKEKKYIEIKNDIIKLISMIGEKYEK